MKAPALSRARATSPCHHTRPLADCRDGVIDLSGDGLIEATSSSLRSATTARLRNHEADHYVRRAGLKGLCERVAERLARNGVVVDPLNEVVITGGIQETRFVAIRELGTEARIAVTVPWVRDHYQPLAGSARATLRDLNPSLTPLEPLVDEVDLLLVANPNPVTGRRCTSETLRRLADAAQRRDLTVIADETAAGLLKPGICHRPLAAFAGAEDRTLTLGSFADIPGLAAWNVAWLAGPAPLVRRVRDLKQAVTICTSAPSQFAAFAGFADAEQRPERGWERVEHLIELLDRLSVPYFVPETVAYVVADVRRFGGGEFAAAACLKNGVRVLSGEHFGRPGQLRVTCTGPLFEEGISRLESALVEMRRETRSSD